MSKLERLLNSVGKKVFVEYYEDFRNLTIGDEEMIKRLPSHYVYSGSKTRVYCARKIFEEGWHIKALQIVVNSRADKAAVEKARELLLIESVNSSSSQKDEQNTRLNLRTN